MLLPGVSPSLMSRKGGGPQVWDPGGPDLYWGYPTMWPIPWCILWYPLPSLQWTDRRLWKHYLPAKVFAVGNKRSSFVVWYNTIWRLYTSPNKDTVQDFLVSVVKYNTFIFNRMTRRLYNIALSHWNVVEYSAFLSFINFLICTRGHISDKTSFTDKKSLSLPKL